MISFATVNPGNGIELSVAAEFQHAPDGAIDTARIWFLCAYRTSADLIGSLFTTSEDVAYTTFYQQLYLDRNDSETFALYLCLRYILGLPIDIVSLTNRTLQGYPSIHLDEGWYHQLDAIKATVQQEIQTAQHQLPFDVMNSPERAAELMA